MGVSKNSGTPKSSILIGFSILNHPFWGTPIFGNIHISSSLIFSGLRLMVNNFFLPILWIIDEGHSENVMVCFKSCYFSSQKDDLPLNFDGRTHGENLVGLFLSKVGFMIAPKRTIAK